MSCAFQNTQGGIDGALVFVADGGGWADDSVTAERIRDKHARLRELKWRERKGFITSGEERELKCIGQWFEAHQRELDELNDAIMEVRDAGVIV